EAAVDLARSATIRHLATVLRRYGWPDDPCDDTDADAGTDAATDVGAGTGADTEPDDNTAAHAATDTGSATGSDTEENAHAHADAHADAAATSNSDASRRPGASRSNDNTDPARITWWWDEQERFCISASLPTDQGLVLEAALRAARRDAWEREHRGDVDDSEPAARNGHGTKRAALALLASSYLDHGP